jgi:diguanylate cyclase (GGDEF)-like protein
MARPLTTPPEFAAWESGSGERPCFPSGIPSGIRPRRDESELPRLWNEEDEDAEPTGETDLKAVAVRASARACLTVMTGGGAGRTIPLDEGSFVVGRSRSCAVHLLDTGVSRVHCRIVVESDTCHVEDIGSRNGTLVNGMPVRRARLSPGDRIQIGDAVLQLDLVDEAEETLARSLFEASTRDPLTRAYNRRYFMTRLEAELSYARRHKSGLGVILLDLDHFKAVNDTWGHATGDLVLRAVVDELERTLRSEDLLTRYGGEELAVLARVGSNDELNRFAERLRARIEALRVPCGGGALGVTVSVGVAAIDECADGSGDDLIGMADRRLYRAKLLGRNRVCAG